MERYWEARILSACSSFLHPLKVMNAFELTRALVDVESITDNEEQMGHVLFAHLSELGSRFGGHAELIPVEPRRNGHGATLLRFTRR